MHNNDLLFEIQQNGYTKVYKVGKGKDKERMTSTNVDGLSYSGNGCAIRRLEEPSWRLILLEKIHLVGTKSIQTCSIYVGKDNLLLQLFQAELWPQLYDGPFIVVFLLRIQAYALLLASHHNTDLGASFFMTVLHLYWVFPRFPKSIPDRRLPATVES